VVRQLGVTTSDIHEVQKVAYERLLTAWFASGKDAPAEWMPSIDHRIVPNAPFDPEAPELAADVPLLVGNTLHEGAFFDPKWEAITDSELRREAEQTHGEHADAVIDALRAIYPTAKPVEILGHMRVAGGLDLRVQTVAQAARKSVQRAPVYAYSFAWRTPVLDGRPRAFHRSELPFFFDNADLCAHMTGGTTAARSLAGKVSGALVQFARTGNPNHAGLPHWPAFHADRVPTMVFDNRCEVRSDHDRAAREAHERAVAARKL
jgi:para-nitrobenzyl esterase